jgi:hypothetical protein
MAKTVQIDFKLFIELYRSIVLEDESADFQHIKQELESKFQKMINHELYSKYKTAATDEEREQARQEYLESVGIPKNFRW